MAAYPQVFSQTYCAMIEANEKSGTLDSGLRQIAKELKQEVETKNQIRTALIQPAIILVVALGVILILCLYVMPQLLTVFDQFNTEPPVATRILIALTNFVNDYITHILVSVLVIGSGIFLFHREPKGETLY
jgi:type II secretory pathway component PulF